MLHIDSCGIEAVLRAERRAHGYGHSLATARGGDWLRGGRCMKGRAIRGQVDVDAFAVCPRREAERTRLKPEASVHGERAEELARIRPQGVSAWATQPPWTDVVGVKAGTGFVGVRMTETTTQEAVGVSRYD